MRPDEMAHWTDTVRDKIDSDIEALVDEMRLKFPHHDDVVWDDHMATNWTGGSEGGSMCDPDDFMVNVVDMVERLRDRKTILATLFADALEACFKDSGEIVAVDMDALAQASEDYEK